MGQLEDDVLFYREYSTIKVSDPRSRPDASSDRKKVQLLTTKLCVCQMTLSESPF